MFQTKILHLSTEHFRPEDGVHIFFRIADIYLQVYTMLQPCISTQTFVCLLTGIVTQDSSSSDAPNVRWAWQGIRSISRPRTYFVLLVVPPCRNWYNIFTQLFVVHCSLMQCDADCMLMVHAAMLSASQTVLRRFGLSALRLVKTRQA
jgi:hypothetical protein